MGLSLALKSLGPMSLSAVQAALEAEPSEPLLRVTASPEELVVEVHPAAEPMRIAQVGEHVELAIKTGTAGAGLHAWACELADRIAARTGGRWDPQSTQDPSGYVSTRDEATLLRYQTAFLAEVASQVLELARTGHTNIALGMPDDVSFDGPSGIVGTPLGPRGEDWLKRVKKDGQAGEDALAWARPGLTAGYFRGLALAHAWMDVRYRPPIDDDERALLDRILDALERAHALEPDYPYDWSLWSELFELRGEESLRATRTHLKAEKNRVRSAVGYRRHPVTVQIGGGFRIRVPGSLKSAWESGGRVWVAWDGIRSLHVSTLRATGKQPHLAVTTEATLEALLRHEPEGEAAIERLSLQRGAIRGQAAVREVDDDGPALEIRMVSAMGPHGALGTFVLKDPLDKAWALEVWGTLDHDDARDFLPS